MSELTDTILLEFMSGAYMGEPATVREQWERCVAPYLIDPKEKDAEIERLKEDVRRWEIVGREADAEIERLKADVFLLRATREDNNQHLEKYEQLITELADWLRRWKGAQNDVVELLQRAREAVLE